MCINFRIFIYYFVLIVVNSVIKNKYIFNKPDLDIVEIPEKWRQLCGYRYKPYVRQFTFKSYCFGSNDILKNMSEVFKKGLPRYMMRLQHGRDVESHESPWTVQLAYKSYSFKSGLFGNRPISRNRHFCTGVLITLKHILTAAHCYKKDKRFAIFAGNSEAFDSKYYITDRYKFFEHPMYRYDIGGETIILKPYDIAMIVLDKEINLAKFQVKSSQIVINTICLPKEKDIVDQEYRPATFFGWGKVTGDIYPATLQRGDIKVRHGQYLTCPEEYCFSSNWTATGHSVTACPGDSGSGLVQYLDQSRNRAFILGIVRSVDPIEGKPNECREGYLTDTHVISVTKNLQWIRDMIRNTSDTN